MVEGKRPNKPCKIKLKKHSSVMLQNTGVVREVLVLRLSPQILGDQWKIVYVVHGLLIMRDCSTYV